MWDERSLLGKKPKFNDIELYLKTGKMTNHLAMNIQDIAEKIHGENDEDIAREIVVFMNKNIPMNRDSSHLMKFRRSAEQILEQKYRNGCCDSSTLFVAIARAKGIPTMQIVSFDKIHAKEIATTGHKITKGHFYAAIFSREDKKWYLVDADKDKAFEKKDVPFHKLDLENRNLNAKYYAFAYVNDFTEIELNGRKIDSISNIGLIQRDVYKLCNKNLIFYENIHKRNLLDRNEK